MVYVNLERDLVIYKGTDGLEESNLDPLQQLSLILQPTEARRIKRLGIYVEDVDVMEFSGHSVLDTKLRHFMGLEELYIIANRKDEGGWNGNEKVVFLDSVAIWASSRVSRRCEALHMQRLLEPMFSRLHMRSQGMGYQMPKVRAVTLEQVSSEQRFDLPELVSPCL